MRRLILCGILATMLCSCTKLYEDMEEERMPRPGYDVEIPIDPPWDGDKDDDNQTGN